MVARTRQHGGSAVDDFLEIYDNALTAHQCEQIIARFEASGKAVRGKTGQASTWPRKTATT